MANYLPPNNYTNILKKIIYSTNIISSGYMLFLTKEINDISKENNADYNRLADICAKLKNPTYTNENFTSYEKAKLLIGN